MPLDAAVIGAGAMGSCLAWHLGKAGLRIGVLARGDRLDQLQRSGVQNLRDGRLSCVPVTASDRLDQVLPAPTVFLCTKTNSLPEVLEAASQQIPSGTTVITVQNGVEAPGQVAAALPQAQVVAARVHGFFEMEGNVLRHVGVPPSVMIGPVAGCSKDAVLELQQMLESAGLSAPVSSDIEEALWEKFLLAAAIGGVGTALGLPAGSILDDPDGRTLLTDAMQEISDLAESTGVALPDNVVANTIAFVGTFPKGATSSLQRDLEAGRPSEYDALTGAVIRLADKVGVSVPVHHRIEAFIRRRGLIS